MQKQTTELIDDLDGGFASESVSFGIDGKQYVIDLSAANAAGLRLALAGFVAHARPAGKAQSTTQGKTTGRGAVSRSDLAEVRVWAAANGYTVAPRGRVPVNVLEAYDKAA